MDFKRWLLSENDFRTGAKLGLYPAIVDALGQYPPLYGIPKAADLITYIGLMYGKSGVPGKDGIIKYDDADPRHSQHFYKKEKSHENFYPQLLGNYGFCSGCDFGSKL